LWERLQQTLNGSFDVDELARLNVFIAMANAAQGRDEPTQCELAAFDFDFGRAPQFVSMESSGSKLGYSRWGISSVTIKVRRGNRGH
jgi:hypothetical protein